MIFCYDFNLHLPIIRPGKHILDMRFCLLCCGVFVLFCFALFFEVTMNSLVKDDLELILLPQPPLFWNYRPPATLLAIQSFFFFSACLTPLPIQFFFLLICRHSLHMVDISVGLASSLV